MYTWYQWTSQFCHQPPLLRIKQVTSRRSWKRQWVETKGQSSRAVPSCQSWVSSRSQASQPGGSKNARIQTDPSYCSSSICPSDLVGDVPKLRPCDDHPHGEDDGSRASPEHGWAGLGTNAAGQEDVGSAGWHVPIG